MTPTEQERKEMIQDITDLVWLAHGIDAGKYPERMRRMSILQSYLSTPAAPPLPEGWDLSRIEDGIIHLADGGIYTVLPQVAFALNAVYGKEKQ